MIYMLIIIYIRFRSYVIATEAERYNSTHREPLNTMETIALVADNVTVVPVVPAPVLESMNRPVMATDAAPD
jgi:hypothetical protein